MYSGAFAKRLLKYAGPSAPQLLKLSTLYDWPVLASNPRIPFGSRITFQIEVKKTVLPLVVRMLGLPHIGKIPTELAKRWETLAAVSSSLSLPTNALLAWNTQHMQRAVERIEAISGEKLQPEDLRRIAPTNLEGINLRGTFDFPLANYASRILPSSVRKVMPSTKRVAG